jgi:isopentenyldiphosphate isomerase
MEFPKVEYLDVVDDLDRVVGRATRAEVHRLRLRHRAAHILVFNRRGEVFLQRRALTKECSPGCWDSSTAGHVAAGEDYDECAWREIEEELGVRPVAAMPRLFQIPACAETGQEFVWVYRTAHVGPFTLDPAESMDGCWLPPAEIGRRLTARPDAHSGTLQLIWRRLALPSGAAAAMGTDGAAVGG